MSYRRIVARRFGGPEVLALERVASPPNPGPGEVRLRVAAAGVGYTDTIVRRGRYRAYDGGLPVTPGYDVVGTVDAIGAGVTGHAVGDRVADMTVTGGYAEYLLRPAEALIAVPADVSPEAAVEVPLMWVTAWQMLVRCATLAPGDAILVVGASGGVGRALVQLGRHLGLRVVGTASAAKLSLVEALGGIAIDYRRPDLTDAVRVHGPVAAAFDAVGGPSWDMSWSILGPGGLLVGYGFQDLLESGAPPEEAGAAMKRLSIDRNAEGRADGTARRTIFYDINTRRGSHSQEYLDDAARLLALIAAGIVTPPPAEVLPLEAAADAHRRIADGTLRHRLVLRP